MSQASPEKRKSVRVLSLTRDLVRRAHPDPIADDRAAMRLLADAEIAAMLDAALSSQSARADST